MPTIGPEATPKANAIGVSKKFQPRAMP